VCKNLKKAPALKIESVLSVVFLTALKRVSSAEKALNRKDGDILNIYVKSKIRIWSEK
jgi:hypothetical protein